MKYEVSKGTLAIVPNDKESSLVYEDDDRYIINESPFRIMEDSLEAHMKEEKTVHVKY